MDPRLQPFQNDHLVEITIRSSRFHKFLPSLSMMLLYYHYTQLSIPPPAPKFVWVTWIGSAQMKRRPCFSPMKHGKKGNLHPSNRQMSQRTYDERASQRMLPFISLYRRQRKFPTLVKFSLLFASTHTLISMYMGWYL